MRLLVLIGLFCLLIADLTFGHSNMRSAILGAVVGGGFVAWVYRALGPAEWHDEY